MADSKGQAKIANAPTRLVEVLRLLPERELLALAGRIGTSIDAGKRVEPAIQVARAVVMLPEVREPWRLPAASAQLLRRIAESGGALVVPTVPLALEPLAALGLVFARIHEPGSFELVLPSAVLLQLPCWEGEDPRGLRALLSKSSVDAQQGMASHYLGKPATQPVCLALEVVLEMARSRAVVEREVAALGLAERRLLEAIEQVGGEVDTEELLDLEREPLRLRGATGATPTRRGVGYALERRAMLVPVHPNRHVIPTEVASVVGAARASRREGKRAQIRAFVFEGEHEPRRARFALDPVPLVLALAMASRDQGAEVREGAGTPRSLLQRLSARFGRSLEDVALLVGTSRALGLWDPAALARGLPPGSLTMPALAAALFGIWRKGGAWDEARPEPEVLRLPADARDPSPVGVVREIVLDALTELGEGRWVPSEALADYVRADARTAGVARLLRRWAERAGFEAPTPTEVAQRIVLESLPALGLVDVGETEPDEDGADAPEPLVRLTPRGRCILQGREPEVEATPSRFVDDVTLHIGTSTTVGAVIALYPFVEIGKVADDVELLVSTAAIGRAVSAGVESDVIRASLEAVAQVPRAVAKALDQMSVVVGRVSLVAASGFLWCDDLDVREMLRTRRQTSDLFVDPSPPGGLLLASGKGMECVARRCRSLGVEVWMDGQVVRARSTLPPGSEPPPKRTTRPPKRTEGARRRSKMPSAG